MFKDFSIGTALSVAAGVAVVWIGVMAFHYFTASPAPAKDPAAAK